MHKIILILLLSTTYIFSNINAVVSILPMQTFLKSIGGEKVNITVMVQPGNSPHTYEPKPSQMIAISKASLYLSIGVEFEEVWLPKFKALNSKMSIVDIAEGVEKLAMQNAKGGHDSHLDHDVHKHEGHDHEGDDPHIWTSPVNVKLIAHNIFKALVGVDAKNEVYYRHNLDNFLKEIESTDKTIKTLLSKLGESRTFMVFHPSWGYFANDYGLKQIAVEIEGKSPKPRELVQLIKEAKKEKVRAIFTQPEFSDSTAKVIAKELHIPVVKVSPLAANWSENLISIAQSISGNSIGKEK